MSQLSNREIRNSLFLLVGLASLSMAASAWVCRSPSVWADGHPSRQGLIASAHSPVAQHRASWQPVVAGIEPAANGDSGQKIEWVHPEAEVKTERSKILKGLEASF